MYRAKANFEGNLRMKLALGGAQFGMDYGVTNRDGQPNSEALAAILEHAANAGIDLIDTAPAYGDSEDSLGAQPAAREFRIVTKTSPGKTLIADPGALVPQFERSLTSLRRERVEALLFHNADVLLAPDGERLFDTALELRESGRVEKIGVSVYDDRQIDSVSKQFAPDLVQVPLNVLDQRLLMSGALAALKASGVEVHVRSAFLQGVLLAPPDTLDARFSRLLPHIHKWRAMLADAGLTPLSGALGFLRENTYVDRIVVGIANLDQLKQITRSYVSQPCPRCEAFAVSDASLIDPRFW